MNECHDNLRTNGGNRATTGNGQATGLSFVNITMSPSKIFIRITINSIKRQAYNIILSV